jgi:hypothetical protein
MVFGLLDQHTLLSDVNHLDSFLDNNPIASLSIKNSVHYKLHLIILLPNGYYKIYHIRKHTIKKTFQKLLAYPPLGLDNLSSHLFSMLKSTTHSERLIYFCDDINKTSKLLLIPF